MIEIKPKNSNQNFEFLEDEANLYIELQKNRIKISQNNLRALLKSDFVEKYNPFLEYFENLPLHDNKNDVIDKLAGYIQISADQRNRFNTQFKKMLVRTVATVLNTKVFNKQMFVLIGGQNSGKTTFLRLLCPKELKDYYTENIDVEDKDSKIALTENFLINIDELASLNRKDINKLKSFISKLYDKSRRVYALREISRPRIASFVGSTNNSEFLTDTTGNVRWLCFKIDGINFNYTKDISINDVWAQAYKLYKEGFEYQLSNEEIKENDIYNNNFMRLPQYTDVLNRYFLVGTKEEHDFFLTASDISFMLKDIFKINTNLYVEHIGKTMIYLGFDKEHKYNPNKKFSEKGYYVIIDNDQKMANTIKDHFFSRVNTDIKKSPF